MSPYLRATPFIIFLMLSLFGTAKNDNVILPITDVQTKAGKVQGTQANGVSVWRGIKYAEAERFKAPRPVQSWSGVKPATEFGPVAPQTQSGLTDKGPQSEDCLYLNIFSPAADGKKRPVMFWIHGGGFVIGSGSADLYDGSKLAKRGDVVIVTINYRLGPWGFLYFKEGNAAGYENNLGIKDQIAALHWVRENIAAFGGDPDQITIFGESAGGTSVETLLSTKLAKGLFKRAIIESGPPAILWSTDVATMLTNKYFSILNVSPDSLDALARIPMDTLKAAEDKLLEYMVANTNYKVFSPTIDGKLLTDDIFKCQKPDLGGNVELMIGTNKHEATMFASRKLKMAPRTREGLEKYFDQVTTHENTKKVTAAYKNYPKTSGVIDILTDAIFRIPAIRLAECRSLYAPVYMYRFEWSSFALNVAGMKSFHGLELPFVFGSYDGRQGKLLKVIATKKLINRLSGEMQDAWINFARYGNPNGTGAQVWKPYSHNERATMIFNNKTRLEVDPDGKQRAAWDGVVYY